MGEKKVAILKDGKDIGRIIPFNVDGDEYDFKISFSKNNYQICIYKFLSNKPEIQLMDDSPEWEISYHRSTISRPTTIHLKEKKNQPQYKELPLKRLMDPDINSEFPIPFMKIEIPNGLDSTVYNGKNSSQHIKFDMEDANVAEFYLANSNFDFENFSNKWPTMSMMLLTSPLEFFATNKGLEDSNKEFFSKDGEPRLAAVEFDLNDDMKFYINLYNNEELDSEGIKVTFIENEYAHAILGLINIRHGNEFGIGEKKPAYLEDLSRGTMSPEEIKKWKYRFERMEKELSRKMQDVQKKKMWLDK